MSNYVYISGMLEVSGSKDIQVCSFVKCLKGPIWSFGAFKGYRTTPDSIYVLNPSYPYVLTYTSSCEKIMKWGTLSVDHYDVST